MSEVKPRGFGAPFWADRLRVVQDRLSVDGGYTEDELKAADAPLLEELSAQTRLDEAMACERESSDTPSASVRRRIAKHRRDLRAAQKAGKR